MEFTHTRLFTSNCPRWGLQKILSNSEEKSASTTKKQERYFGGCLKSMFIVCFQATSECAPAKNGMIQQGHEFTFSKILDPPPFLGKFMFKKQC